MNISLILFFSTLLVILPFWNLTLKPEDFKYCTSFLLLTGFLCASFFIKKQGKRITSGKFSSLLVGLYALYGIYLLVNWYILSTPYYGMRGMAYMWLCFMGFILGASVFSSQKNTKPFFMAIIAGCVFASLYAYAEYFAWVPSFYPVDWPPRITGLFDNRNVFSVMIIWGVSLALYYMFWEQRVRYRIAYGSAALICSSTIAITNSRSIFLFVGIGAAAIIVALVLKLKKAFSLRLRISLYAGTFFVGLFALLFWDDTQWVRILSLLHPFQDGSVTGRLEVYKAAWQVFLHQPIFGCGIGNFLHGYIPYFPPSVSATMLNFSLAQHAESEYLEVLSETGIIGISLFLFFIIGGAVVQIKRLGKKWQWNEYLLLVLYVILLINGVYDASVRFMPIGLLLWVIAGKMWSPVFLDGINCVPPKAIIISKQLLLGISLIIALFYYQIMISDFFYIKYVRQSQTGSPDSKKSLAISLKLFSAQPDALYCSALNSFAEKQYYQTWDIAQRLDRLAPNYRTTDYLRALVLAESNQTHVALNHIDKAIQREPVDLNLKGFKIALLAKSGQCIEAQRLKDSLGISRLQTDTLPQLSTSVSEEELIESYRRSTNKNRRLIGGSRLFKTYMEFRSRTMRRGQADTRLNQWIKNIPCE